MNQTKGFETLTSVYTWAQNYQTETKPERAGVFFNVDVLQESGMKILVLRENLTSFSETMFVKNEQKPTLREALIILTSKLRADQQITIRVDTHSSLEALKLDKNTCYKS